ncbi:hypothetical protein [uncultured Jatrophihabitans sp.]|uniref:hypothetical protein n=1 Tax=uncultured Jatrophihabitans sp. TaxID=1610747 RepID=UPI0035CA9443
MLPIGWFVVAVVLAILLTMWVTFTLTRLDRLHARVDAAEAALDAQLVRRAVAVGHLIDASRAHLGEDDRAALGAAAQRVAAGTVTDRATSNERQVVENTVGRAVTALLAEPVPLDPAAESELREAAARVLIARRFYNDAVRDTRSLRARRMPRLLHLAGHRDQPEFFDIDDTLPPTPVAAPADARLDAARPLDERLKEDR